MPVAAIIAAGVTAGGVITASKLNSSATRDSAKLATDANTNAATIQAKSAADTLAFQRQQAETDFQNNQQTARANYDQWATGQGRLKSLAAMTGIARPDPPPFVPGIDPQFTGGSPLPSSTTAGPTATGAPGSVPTVDWTAPAPQLASQLTAYFAAKGAPPTEVPYWVSKAGELVTRGQQLNDPSYPDKRLAAANILGGGAPTAAPTATPTAAPYSMATAAYGAPATPILAPGVTGMAPYKPYSFADMVA